MRHIYIILKKDIIMNRKQITRRTYRKMPTDLSILGELGDEKEGHQIYIVFFIKLNLRSHTAIIRRSNHLFLQALIPHLLAIWIHLERKGLQRQGRIGREEK